MSCSPEYDSAKRSIRQEFTPEEAVRIAKAAGLDTTGLEEQVGRRADSGPDLAENVANLEAELQRRAPEPPASPEQQQREFAGSMLEHLNASVTPWHEFGGMGGGNRG